MQIKTKENIYQPMKSCNFLSRCSSYFCNYHQMNSQKINIKITRTFMHAWNGIGRARVHSRTQTNDPDSHSSITSGGTFSVKWKSASVDHEGVRLHGSCRVVQRVRVLGRLALQLALVAQRSGSAITEEPFWGRQSSRYYWYDRTSPCIWVCNI